MTAGEAARKLAAVMNEIESNGFILYPHPRPVGISIRKLKDGITSAKHPDDTIILVKVWDEGDGSGWTVKL